MHNSLAYELAPRLPDYPPLASETIAIDLDRYERNAQSRAEQARQARLTLIAVWVVCVAALAWSVAVGPMRAEAQFQSDLRR